VLLAAVLAAPLAFGGGPGFRTPHLLEDHFARFGSQFGPVNIQQYLHLAQQLRDTPPGRNILISKRPDGGGAKFDLRRGWFVAYDGDGTLRTFFIPTEGVRFFEKQQKSGAPPE
jgi:pyocin large subunit-like protein